MEAGELARLRTVLVRHMLKQPRDCPLWDFPPKWRQAARLVSKKDPKAFKAVAHEGGVVVRLTSRTRAKMLLEELCKDSK